MFIDMNKEQTTIIMVNYKNLNQQYFYKSLSSAIAQTFNDYKIDIYLDNVSFKLKLNYKINIFAVPRELYNKPVAIREYALNNTDTEFICFWDSDDIFAVKKLDILYGIIKEKSCDLCFSNFGFFNNKKILNTNFFDLIGLDNREINILDENYIGLGSTIIKTEYLKSLMPFPKIDRLDWWIAIRSYCDNIKISKTSKILAYYRIYNSSLSSLLNKISKEDFAEEIKCKINLYSLLKIKYPLLEEREDFYRSLDINKDYGKLKENYKKNKFKNFWGGLITYENK